MKWKETNFLFRKKKLNRNRLLKKSKKFFWCSLWENSDTKMPNSFRLGNVRWTGETEIDAHELFLITPIFFCCCHLDDLENSEGVRTTNIPLKVNRKKGRKTRWRQHQNDTWQSARSPFTIVSRTCIDVLLSVANNPSSTCTPSSWRQRHWMPFLLFDDGCFFLVLFHCLLCFVCSDSVLFWMRAHRAQRIYSM